MAVMKASEFVRRLIDVANNHKTLYVMGCFGAPLTAANKERYCTNHDYNRKPARTKLIRAASEDTFGFDCVCLLKGVLWGWNGDQGKTYGGAKYTTNGVPDVSADGMINLCSGVTANFSKIEIGEALWCRGHIGVYIGDGLAVECTPAWKNKVQITAVANIGRKAGYNARTWTKHGKLPYIEYDAKAQPPAKPSKPSAGTPATGTASTGSASDEKAIWSYLLSKIGNEYGVAGLMGNIYAESGLRSDNLQNVYERKLGYTDDSYTAAVDSGAYTNFVRDAAGYGLCQWTYWSRKEALLAFAQAQGRSIGDWKMQVAFLMKELSESYKGVLEVLETATSVKQASDIVLTKFERPADQGNAAKNRRANFGQRFYKAYGSSQSKPTTKPGGTVKIDYAQKYDKRVSGSYVVTAASGLRLRSGASTSKPVLMVMLKGATVRCYGYYSLAPGGATWLYVQAADGTVGFCSSEYLKKS